MKAVEEKQQNLSIHFYTHVWQMIDSQYIFSVCLFLQQLRPPQLWITSYSSATAKYVYRNIDKNHITKIRQTKYNIKLIAKSKKNIILRVNEWAHESMLVIEN